MATTTTTKRHNGVNQLLFDMATDEALEALEAFWLAFCGLALITDDISLLDPY